MRGGGARCGGREKPARTDWGGVAVAVRVVMGAIFPASAKWWQIGVVCFKTNPEKSD